MIHSNMREILEIRLDVFANKHNVISFSNVHVVKLQ